MSLFINTNIASLYAQNNVANSQSALATSIQRLSSGLRINSAKDDAAGMAIAARMTSQIGGMTQAAQNANDGISLAQTAEGALAQVTNDLQTIRNLSVQAANGTNSSSDRASLQASVSQLQQDINQISTNTQYNGLNLLDGSLTNVQFQIGANANQTINASIGTSSANSMGSYSLAGPNSTPYAGIMVDAATSGVTAANVYTKNNVAVGTLTISGNNTTSGAVTINANMTGDQIAATLNTNAGNTNVTTAATTTATLSGFTAGTVNLNIGSISSGAAGTTSVNVSATLTSSTDLSSLTASINSQTGQTGITAVVNGSSIVLTQAQGKDIGVQMVGTTAEAVTVTGQPTTVGGTGTGVTLASGTALASTAVGALVTFNSPNSFTTTTSAAGITKTTGVSSSSLSSVGSIDVTKVSLGIPTGANEALSIADAAINYVNGLRANLGALQNRFSNAQSSLTTTSTNMQQARSRIQDTDFAAETANLTHNQILQQAGTAMLAQANALPNSVLTLLK